MVFGRGRDQAEAKVDEEMHGLVTQLTNEITFHMRERGLSRAELAARVGVSPGRISQILGGGENLTLPGRVHQPRRGRLRVHREPPLVPADPAPEERLPPSLGPPSLRPATAAACGRPRPVTGHRCSCVTAAPDCGTCSAPSPVPWRAPARLPASGGAYGAHIRLTEHERERLTLIVSIG